MRAAIWRSAGIVLVAAMTAAALYLPPTAPPSAETEPLISLETDVTCPLTEPVGSRNNDLTVVVSEPGTIGALVFAAGEELGADVVEMPAVGGTRVDLSEIAAVAAAPTLLTFPTGIGRGESVLYGETSISASGCAVPTNTSVSVGGAATDDGEDVALVLVNPYAIDARLNVTIISENGTEANRDLETFVVPPRTSNTINLTALFPGRLRIGAVVTPEVGSVVAGLRWSAESDLAESTAVPLADDQYFVVPATDPPGSTRLILQSIESVDVPVRVDVTTDNGEITTTEEVVPARGSVDLGIGGRRRAMTVRVRASAPIGADIRMAGRGGRALLPGTVAASGLWFVPGAGVGPAGAIGKVSIHVPGGNQAVVGIGPLDGDPTREVEIAAGRTRTVRVPAGISNGVRVTANVPVILSFSTERDRALGADTALPVIDPGD